MIKPKLDSEGRHVKDHLQQGEYFYNYVVDDYTKWASEFQSPDKLHIYVDTKWIPQIGEKYYYWDFERDYVSSVYMGQNSYIDNYRIRISNYFKTQEEIGYDKLESSIEKMGAELAIKYVKDSIVNSKCKADLANSTDRGAPGKGEYYYYFDFGSCSAKYVINNNDYIDKYRIKTDNFAKSSVEFTNKKLKGILFNMALQLT